jgi:hypothetical protein
MASPPVMAPAMAQPVYAPAGGWNAAPPVAASPLPQATPLYDPYAAWLNDPNPAAAPIAQQPFVENQTEVGVPHLADDREVRKARTRRRFHKNLVMFLVCAAALGATLHFFLKLAD